MLRAILIFMLTLWPTLALAAPDVITVLYFHNQGNPALEPLKVGLAQMMTTDLVGIDGVTVVERQQLQGILDELELGHSGIVDGDTAAKVGKLLGARYIVMGSYFELAGTLRIDARMVEVQTGRIVHAHGVDGRLDGFLTLQKDLAGDLRSHLEGGTPPDKATPKKGTPGKGGTRGEPVPDGKGAENEPPGQPERPSDTPPAGAGDGLARHDADTVSAALAYSEGLIFLDKKETARARESFQKAVAADPALQAARQELASLDL